jgi:hypothetical protein
MALERTSQGLRSKTLHHRSRGCLLTNAVSGALVRSATNTIGSERGSGLRRMVDVEEIGLLRTIAGAINRFEGFELGRPEEPVQAAPGSG